MSEAIWVKPEFSCPPRRATWKEVDALKAYVAEISQGDYGDMLDELIASSCIAVFDGYQPDSPGWCGTVMLVHWPSAETQTFYLERKGEQLRLFDPYEED